MNDQDFMKIVVTKGKQRLAAKELPLISLMVKDNLIIAEGHGTPEPSGHNDLNCINHAAKKLNTLDLSDCTLYTTIEPCSMCLAAASWAGLNRVVFGAFQKDVSKNKYEISDYHAIEHAQKLIPTNGKKMEVIGGILQTECTELMKNVKGWVLSK